MRAWLMMRKNQLVAWLAKLPEWLGRLPEKPLRAAAEIAAIFEASAVLSESYMLSSSLVF
jgi:hypothetical protein